MTLLKSGLILIFFLVMLNIRNNLQGYKRYVFIKITLLIVRHCDRITWQRHRSDTPAIRSKNNCFGHFNKQYLRQ